MINCYFVIMNNYDDNIEEANSWSGPVGSFDMMEAPRLFTERQVYRLYTVVRSGRRYILKALRPELAEVEAYRALLRKEFQLANSLDHQGIVSVFSLERNPVAGECIVMEYVDGTTLAEYLRTKPAKAERRRVAIELAEALSYLHSRGISHRDLKPDNLMITAHGHHLRIIDFGVGDADDFEMLKASGATEDFGAPEQLAGDGAIVGPSADVWAYGAILKRLSCGLPYRAIASRCQRKRAERRPEMVDILRRVKRFDRFNAMSVVAVPAMLLAGVGVGFLIFGGGQSRESLETASQTAVIAEDDTTSVPIIETEEINTPNTVNTHNKTVEATTLDNQILIDSLYNSAVAEARNIILAQKANVISAQDAGFEELQTAMRELNDSLNKLSNDFSDRLRKAGIPEYQVADFDRNLYNKIADLEEEAGL